MSEGTSKSRRSSRPVTIILASVASVVGLVFVRACVRGRTGLEPQMREFRIDAQGSTYRVYTKSLDEGEVQQLLSDTEVQHWLRSTGEATPRGKPSPD